ncbi:YncE family protein [Pseudomonas proteolytica]|uniref:YncE family protein n=1 Tax=Pseudomonas proteolytica TaxID=219574 RepID=UPI00147346BB|nr:YncE family protein [Pseudomonas proteolytica]NMZ03609.1 YncE family protein [Pseudomonas proteolytica]
MSNLPMDPSNEPVDDQVPAQPLSQDLVLYHTPELPPTRVEDLDPPYSAYLAVPLEQALYPENAVYALGIRQVQPYSYWFFERWFTWSSGDYYAIYIDNLVEAKQSGIAYEDKPRYGLIVPEETMPRGEVTLYGRVLRTGSFQESTSPLQTILIKTDRPGGTDQDPGATWHTRLIMSIEGFPENSVINQENSAGGVWCLIEPYPYIRKNDKIEFSWDGVIVIHIVSPEEAAGSGPIRIWVSKSVIDQGGLNGKLILRFRVQDVAENISGDKYQYSQHYLLQSELDPSLSPAPFFLIDGVESSQVDFDTDSEKTFSLQCYTDREVPAPNPPYQVVVTLYATLIDGSTRTFSLPPVNASNLFLTEVPVPREIIEQTVGGSFRASFQLLTAGGAFLKQSGSVTVTVVGTPVSMPGVTIVPIELGLIDPDSDIEITIPFYEPHDPDWLETLVIESHEPGGGSATYTDAQLAGPQGGSYRVTAQDLQQFRGHNIYVYYLVNDGAVHVFGGQTQAIRKSLEVGAQVGERLASLPAPHLQYAQGNNINPAHVPGANLLLTLPYTGTQSGDEVYWVVFGSAVGGSANGTITVNGATAGQPLVFAINRNLVDSNLNGSLRISYSLQRGGPGGTILRSEILDLTVGVGVQLERPIIEGASLLPDRLNPLAAEVGAWVSVRFIPMHATDQIDVDWLSSDGIGSYTAKVQGNPGTNEVRAFIPPEFIAKGIRPDGNQISVQYRFMRGSFLYESQVVDLELQPLTGLPTPSIDGIGDNMVLELSQLNEEARTRIAKWSFIAPNQRMWMTYEGTFEDGTPYVENTYTANLVTAAGVLNGISPPTPVDKLRRLKDGSQLTIHFWVTLSESADKNSAVLFGVRVHSIQAIPSTLPRPQFANLPGQAITIDPLTYENNASVVVAYPGMNSTHRIKLLWLLPNGDIPYIADKDGLAGGRVDFLISPAIMAASVGKKVTVRYIATINGVDVDSFTQEVNVQVIQAANLPRPVINNIANGGTLDLNTFTGNATASVAKWRLSAAGQRVWLTCSSAGVSDLYVINGVAITATEAANGLINKTVWRTWLEALPTGRQITVTCKVTFDGSTKEVDAIAFTTTTYLISASPGFIDQIFLGFGQFDIVASLTRAEVYVSYPGRISVIDTTQNRIIRSVPASDAKERMALHPNGSSMYIPLKNDNSIEIVNINTGARSRIINIPSPSNPTFNATGSRLYVSNSTDNFVYVIDTFTAKIIHSISITGPSHSMLGSNNRLYVSTRLSQIAVIDVNTYQILAYIPITTPGSFLAQSPHRPVFYLGHYDKKVSVINMNTNMVEKVIPINGEVAAIAFSNIIEKACVAGYYTNSIDIINTQTDSTSSILQPAYRPLGIAIPPESSVAYVCSNSDHVVYVVQL